MACMDICPKEAIQIKDTLSSYNAVIDEKKCVGCNACHKMCQVNHPVNTLAPISWRQGWNEEPAIRKECSSGGVATAIAKAFIESGGEVCSCTFTHGEFIFEFADDVYDLKKFAGSKYVKSNPHGIYKIVQEKLKKNKKVLFIGLPCQAAALKKFMGDALSDNLFTVDLICHGTPSPKVLSVFLEQYGLTLKKLKDIKFRVKAKFQIYSENKGVITNGVSDRYSIAFLNSLIYTENCYNCPYAKEERVSDVTLGDSWGSELSVEEQRKGISLVLSQTEKGNKLLQIAKIHLENVDKNKAIDNNHQLKHPSIRPDGRNAFFRGLENTKFNTLVRRQFPKQCLRQDIKCVLIRARILRRANKE